MAYANSADSEDPDETIPEGAVWSGSIPISFPLCILRYIYTKSKIQSKKKKKKKKKKIKKINKNK